MASDGDNLYVIDFNDYVIRQIVLASGEVRTIAGEPGMSGTVDDVGAAARFSSLSGIAYDGNVAIWVTDNNTVRKIELATKRVTTLLGAPGQAALTDGVGTASRFLRSGMMTYDGRGNLFVVDALTVVRRIELATLTVSTVMGKAPEAIVRPGPLSTALLNTTVGIAALPSGDLLLSEDIENVVLLLRQP